MKIQAINNQVSSKGIYVDRSNENHRNWKMVYHPYSWELDGEGKPYIAPKNNAINIFNKPTHKRISFLIPAFANWMLGINIPIINEPIRKIGYKWYVSLIFAINISSFFLLQS